MPILTRVKQLIFGSGASSAQFGQIGSKSAGSPVTTKDLSTIQSLSQYLNGLYAITANAVNPPYIEDLNSLYLLITTQLAYLLQNGVPEWESTTDYFADISFVQVAGAVYKSVSGTSLSPNNGNNPTTDTGTNWKLVLAGIIPGSVWPSLLTLDSLVFGGGTFSKSSASLSGVSLDNGTTTSPGLEWFYGNNVNGGIYVGSNGSLHITENLNETGSSDWIELTVGGNVGIGRTPTTMKLEINGDLGTTGTIHVCNNSGTILDARASIGGTDFGYLAIDGAGGHWGVNRTPTNYAWEVQGSLGVTDHLVVGNNGGTVLDVRSSIGGTDLAYLAVGGVNLWGINRTPTNYDLEIGGSGYVGATEYFKIGSGTVLDVRSTFGGTDYGYLYCDSSGNWGINTQHTLGPITVGDLNNNNGSVDPQIIVDRAVDDSVTGNGHCFTDASVVTRSGTIGYCSFDARPTLSGTNNFNHVAAFQVSASIATSGTTTNFFGVLIDMSVTSGTLTNAYGVYVEAFGTASGGIQQNVYGIYLESQTQGATRWAFYANNSPSFFGGGITPANTIANGSETLGSLYDLMSPMMINSGQTIFVNGAWYSGSTLVVAAYAHRVDASTITLYGMLAGGSYTSVTLTHGNSSTISCILAF